LNYLKKLLYVFIVEKILVGPIKNNIRIFISEFSHLLSNINHTYYVL